MSRFIWYLKQLLPLRYESVYLEGGKRMLCIWRMWFGRCFNVRYHVTPVTVEFCVLCPAPAGHFSYPTPTQKAPWRRLPPGGFLVTTHGR